MKISCICEDVEQFQFSCAAGGNVKWYNYFGKLIVSLKTTTNTYQINELFYSSNLLERIDDIYPHKGFTCKYSEQFMQDNQKRQITPMFINGCMSK